MESSTKEFLALTMWTVMCFMIFITGSMIKAKIKLYFYPPDDLAWPKKFLGRKIKFQHPVYKGVEGTGTIVGIRNTKERGKGGVPKYKLDVDEGSGSITPIWLDSKWEYADVKNKP